MAGDQATKVCVRCHAEKTLAEFPLRKSTKDGRSGFCRDCKQVGSAAAYRRARDGFHAFPEVPGVAFRPMPCCTRHIVGDDGLVRRFHGRSKGRGGSFWKTLTGTPDSNGYRMFMLHKKHLRAHKAVLEAFVGPRPEGLVCCHYDGDPWNSRLDNLRWDTPQANKDDAFRHGRVYTRLTPEIVKAIRADHAAGLGYRRIGKRYSVARSLVARIVRRQRWARI
jgi:hypothetical protein